MFTHYKNKIKNIKRGDRRNYGGDRVPTYHVMHLICQKNKRRNITDIGRLSQLYGHFSELLKCHSKKYVFYPALFSTCDVMHLMSLEFRRRNIARIGATFT